jgi:hypothetical protein
MRVRMSIVGGRPANERPLPHESVSQVLLGMITAAVAALAPVSAQASTSLNASAKVTALGKKWLPVLRDS